ncbi:caspase family protein [Streptomyces sp. NPDC001388]|uniref:caspase family protein n=1 Tax=Streptomyces sp. NPDC001388 TaxID=3364568 RepID=UPI003673E933
MPGPAEAAVAAQPATSAPTPDAADRRFLVAAAVTDVTAHPEAERAELAADVRRIEDLFLGELRYHRATDLPALNPTRRQLQDALRAFATAPDRRPEDYVVLYLATHGVTAEHSGRHYLLLHDSDARDLRGTALPTEDLVAQLWEDTPVERLLVLIDACYAEEGADRALRGALEARRFREPVTEHGTTGLVLVSSSRRKEEAYTGALSAAFDRAVRRQATAGHVPAHISLEHVMAAIRSDPEVPAAQRPVWSLAHATGDIPAFLPNPRHVPDSAGLKLEEIDRIVALGARERDAREKDMRGFFVPRARGTDVPTEDVWDFTGRHAALGDITAWLDPRRTGDRLCVVTGDPGSGKSSLLGMVAVLTDPLRHASVPRTGLPALLPRAGDVDVRVNASHLSTRQLLDALSAAAGCAAGSLGALTAHLQTRTDPLVVLVDSLDEALTPHEAVDELLTPLTDPERRLPLRLLIGARPHIAARLPTAAPRIDLDSERYGDPDAVRTYTRKLLRAPGSVLGDAADRLVDAVAEAVSEAAGRSFLVARITARTIAREPRPPDPYDRRWRDELPRLPGEAMERDLVQRLGPQAARARDLLLPLAYAQGAGLPWAAVWPRLAAALSGKPYDDEHIVWLRQAAGSYVVESVESGGSVYRVYHRALIEYLREDRDTETIQRTVTEVLRDIEHPYVRRYLALHAGEGGVLDPLVQDADFVLSAEPGQLLAALPGLRTAEGRRAGQAVRDLEEPLRRREGAGPDPETRARLRLAAVCRQARALADSCDAGEGELPWRARWAAWNPHEGARRYPGMTVGTRTGVVVPGDGDAQYLELSWWDGVRAWDLDDGTWSRVAADTGDPYRSTLTVLPQLPGGAAAVAYGDEVEIRGRTLWRTRHARLLHLYSVWRTSRTTWCLPPDVFVDVEPERRIPRAPEQLALTADDDGNPDLAVLRFDDGQVAVYRLDNRTAYPPLPRDSRRSLYDNEAKEWQARFAHLAAGEHTTLGPRADDDPRRITACAAPRGLAPRTLLVGYEDGEVLETDLRQGTRLSQVNTGHDSPVTHIGLVTGHPQGRLLVTAARDGTVRVSSLTTGRPLRPLLSSAFPIASFSTRRVGRQWIVAVVTADGSLHRIDLDSGRPIGLPLRVDRGSSVRVETFALRGADCVSVQGDSRGLQVYDLVSGARVGGQEFRHEASAVCAAGGTVCVGGSDGVVRLWPTPQAADSTQITAHDGAVLALGRVRGPSGRPALVSVGLDNEIRCWDAERSHELWRRRVLDPGPWQVPLLACATTGRRADGRDFVATGEHQGRVRVLLLSDGLPVAEQEFTVPDIVTALAAGRVRGRDVLAVGTGSGRIACWDLGAARMYALGPEPRRPLWTTALALAPDGSGRLATGGLDGTVREWSLPTCRPLGPARPGHRRRVTALAYAGGRLVGCGADHRLVSYADGGERRMPMPLVSFGEAADGSLLGGDERGRVWRVEAGDAGLAVTEALDAVRPVSAVATVAVDGSTAVVAGSPDGSLEVREGERGRLVRRLRPVCESGVRELAGVSWRSPGRQPRPLLFARSEWGVLECWDFAAADPISSQGLPLATPVAHQDPRATLSVQPGGDGTQAVLSLAPWDARPSRPLWDSDEDTHLAVLDVARGPVHSQPCRPLGENAPQGPFRAVRCGGTLLVFVPLSDRVVRVLDTRTRRWAALPEDDLVEVFALAAADGDEIVVVGGESTRVYAWESLRTCFTRPGERPAEIRPVTARTRLGRRAAPPPPPLHEHAVVLPTYKARHAVLLPGGEAYAVAAQNELAVASVRDGAVLRGLELPSPCTALAAGPGGELLVGTRNGLVLFD